MVMTQNVNRSFVVYENTFSVGGKRERRRETGQILICYECVTMEWVPHRNCCCCSNCFTIGANSDTEPKEKGSDGTEQGEDVRKRARYSGLVLCIAYDVMCWDPCVCTVERNRFDNYVCQVKRCDGFRGNFAD